MRIMIIVLVLLFAAPAWAQQAPVCDARANIVKFLADKYKEEPLGIGTTVAGLVMELWASEAGTWTMLMSSPNGMSCFISTGNDWVSAPVRPQGTAM